MVFLIKNFGNNKVGVFDFAFPLLPFGTKLLVGIRASPLLLHTEVLRGSPFPTSLWACLPQSRAAIIGKGSCHTNSTSHHFDVQNLNS